jgi:hypothetical protein
MSLDGNVLAGALADVFSFEITAALVTCAGCGTQAPAASWVVFAEAPGMVARCRTCERVQLRVVSDGRGRTWVDLSGVALLEVGETR